MPPIFVWRGPEEDLAYACVATEFVIEVLEDRGDKKFAAGTISAKDYVEHGIRFSDPWEAFAIPQDDGPLQWNVKREQTEGKGCFFKDPTTKEILFTGNSEINKAMKRFIAQKINLHLTTGETLIEPEKYTGPREAYEGPCVCDQLINSNSQTPFPWDKMTNEGKFPQRCFACSCGKNWWRYNPEAHLWEEVGDPNAWEMLLDNNGIPVQAMCSLEGKLLLLQTFSDEGYVPIG